MIAPLAGDQAALRAACQQGVGLCTITHIEGSFSRRLGAQLAVHPDGTVTGSLADGCLEQELAREIARGGERRVIRYGAGSANIDFRLPCGGGLDILIDPDPDRSACKRAVAALDTRKQVSLALPVPSPLALRRYVPDLRLV
ncbi:MAG: XdhC family protein, partial [Alteraurantiacibacter sp.]